MTKMIELLRAAVFTGALCFIPLGAHAEGNVPDHQEAEETPAAPNCQKAPGDVPDHQEAQSRCGDDEKGVENTRMAPNAIPDHQEAEEPHGANTEQ